MGPQPFALVVTGELDPLQVKTGNDCDFHIETTRFEEAVMYWFILWPLELKLTLAISSPD